MGAAAALVAAQAAFLLAPLLPAGAPAQPAITAGVLLVCGVVVASAVPLSDVPLLLVPALAGGWVVVAALEVAGADAAATPVEAFAWGAAGVAFIAIFATGTLVVALPLFVAAVALLSGTGAAEAGAAPGDALALTLPDWGGGPPAARLGATEAAFLGAFAASARRFGLREAATTGGMAAALLVALLTGAGPALALLAAGALLPNLDRLAVLVRGEHGG